MNILVIGATGTIGRAIVQALAGSHDVVRVSRTGGDRQADIADPASLRTLFESTAPFDAVVCAAAQAVFGSLTDLSDEDFDRSLSGKLMGQVNVVRQGLAYIADGGSFTLTSGMFSRYPIPGSAPISLVNAGVEAFARAAALELPRDVRVNAVSPPRVLETLESRDPSPGLRASTVARAYVASVEGDMSGEVLDARDYA